MTSRGVFTIFISLLLSSCDFSIRKSPFSSPEENAFPANAVVAFNSSTCPAGWIEFSALKGRTILGAGSGNTDHLGAPLTVRSLGQAGGVTYTTSIPAYSGAGDNTDPDPSFTLAAPASDLFINISSSDAVMDFRTEGNMAPYLVQKFCKNTNSSKTIPANTIIAIDQNSCSSEWAPVSQLNGRMILGEGSGNLDVLGVALPAKTLGQVGGYQFTVLDLRINANTAASNSPDPSMTFGVSSFYTYSSGNPDTSLYGSPFDANMPPFTVVQYCGSPIGSAKIESGTVIAFDQATCPTGWSSYLPARGRVLFGAGSGNVDANGNPLSARIFGQTGGLEYTSGIPVYANNGDSDSPEGARSLAIPSGDVLFSSMAPNQFLYYSIQSANLPPYYTLLYCKKD